jgi:O-antigen/teichoic acid export membrane protein
MSGQQKKMARAQVIAVAIGLTINWLLIPRLGLTGAAGAAAVTNGLLNILWLREVNRTLSLHPSSRGYFSLLLPALATLGAVWFVRQSLRASHHDFLIVIAGLITGYTVFLLSSLAIGLDDSDRMLARSAWEQIRRSFGPSAA